MFLNILGLWWSCINARCRSMWWVEIGEKWEVWAYNQLMSTGSLLLAKLSNVQYIVLARLLLIKTNDLLFEGSVSSTHGIFSISWWLARVLLLQQRILDERSSSLFDLLQVFTHETLHQFGIVEQVSYSIFVMQN